MNNRNLEYEPLIPDGSYSVTFIGYNFTHTFGNPRLKLYFQIAELSEYKNCVFTKWLNVIYYDQKKNGKFNFKVSKRSDFIKLWKKIFPDLKIKRFDRFTLSNLKGIVLQAKIKASVKDYKQKLVDEDLRISKIVDLKS